MLDTPLLAEDTLLPVHPLHQTQSKSYKHRVLVGTHNPAVGEIKVVS